MITVLFGQPHSGKTTLAKMLCENTSIYNIDGDTLRDIFQNKDYSREGRIKNLNRASDIATYLHYNGNNVILSLVYPYKECRDYLNSLVSDVKWIFLYYEVDRGREQYHVKDFDYPSHAAIFLNTEHTTEYECIDKIKKYIS